MIRVRIENSGDQGHEREIGQACGLHLDHEIGPIVLDRSRADPKVVRTLFVGMSSHQSLEDIALAVRQRREAGLDIAALGLTLLISIPLSSADRKTQVEPRPQKAFRELLHTQEGVKRIFGHRLRVGRDPEIMLGIVADRLR